MCIPEKGKHYTNVHMKKGFNKTVWFKSKIRTEQNRNSIVRLGHKFHIHMVYLNYQI